MMCYFIEKKNINNSHVIYLFLWNQKSSFTSHHRPTKQILPDRKNICSRDNYIHFYDFIFRLHYF